MEHYIPGQCLVKVEEKRNMCDLKFLINIIVDGSVDGRKYLPTEEKGPIKFVNGGKIERTSRRTKSACACVG